MIHVNCDPSRPTFRNLDIIDSIPENFLTLHVPVVKMWFFFAWIFLSPQQLMDRCLAWTFCYLFNSLAIFFCVK